VVGRSADGLLGAQQRAAMVLALESLSVLVLVSKPTRLVADQPVGTPPALHTKGELFGQLRHRLDNLTNRVARDPKNFGRLVG
jgi:hypothetical protein